MKSTIAITFIMFLLWGCGPSKEEKEKYWREQTIVFEKLYNNQEYEQALTLAKKRVKLAEEEFEGRFRLSNAYNDLALLYRDLQHTQEAEKYFVKALSIPNKAGNNTATIYDNLALLCRNTERFEEAVRYSNKAITAYQQDENPDSAGLYRAKIGLVKPLLVKQDYPAASQLIEQVYQYGKLKADSSLILEAMHAQVSLFLFSSREEEALPYIAALQAAYQRKKQNVNLAQTYNSLGAVYFGRQNYDSAIEQFRKAAQLKFDHYQDSTFIVIEMKNIAFAFKTKGDTLNATQYWRTYQRIKK